jgi:thioredoxin-like negative regulator of GroEL
MKELKSPEDVKKSMKSTKPVAIFFYMSTCPHCTVMHSPWDKLSAEMKDVDFEKVESEHVPADLGIMGYPHFVLVKDGKQKKTAGGEMTKDELKSKLFSSAGKRPNRGRSRRLRRSRLKSRHRTARRRVSFR